MDKKSTLSNSAKKNILVFHPALAPYRVDFFNAIDKYFNAFFYFSLPNPIEQDFDQKALRNRCSFQCNYLDKGFEFFGRSFRFNSIGKIKSTNPDVILCSEYSPITCLTVLYVSFFRKKTKVYTLCDDSIANSKERKGIRSYITKVIAKYIDGIIFTNEEVANWYKMNVSKKPKILILPIIHNEVVYKENLEQSINLANNNIGRYNLLGKKIILYVGRLVEVKNLDFLMTCVSKINQNDFCLIIVGDGPLRVELEEQARSLSLLDKVIFIGKQENESLYNWYTFSNIFVLPSTSERFGAVVNEALIGGCFVLCSSLAGASSLINNENGLLFDPTNEMDLVEKLEIALNNSSVLENKIEQLRVSKMPIEFDTMFNTLINQF
ncbi:glycosyl transferase [Flavobacterium alvei]|uniref:Glycosyl transferase n=1 Tax=Flavobacterium alvei TaxID=2080416 RepID=A0A2S5A6Z7_9FLAO|nr:glycosyltransferase [Flavobacterium alvei]POY38112.1 glycosyl transferase [Flavobacterium alvei]